MDAEELKKIIKLMPGCEYEALRKANPGHFFTGNDGKPYTHQLVFKENGVKKARVFNGNFLNPFASALMVALRMASEVPTSGVEKCARCQGTGKKFYFARAEEGKCDVCQGVGYLMREVKSEK